MKRLKQLGFAALLCLSFAACKKDGVFEPQPQTVAEQKPATKSSSSASLAQVAAGFPEDFESGTKGSYASGTVSLSSGSWTLDDALIGNLAADAKNGSQSVRMRNTGTLTMNFDVSGADVVTIAHAKYGSDANSTWQLWYSTNAGSTWQQSGSTVTSSSTSLSTVTFNTALTGNVRFQVRKISGGTARINIDDFSISNSGGTTPPGTPTDNSHLLLGNPSNAEANTLVPENYLMDKTYYVSSYSKSRGIPNWVSWHIGSSDLGSTPRQDDFRADTSLPSGWYQVGSSSYSGSGFDRGHNCPSADRTASVAANSSTFLMTNMMPQAPNNNQGPWADLEDYTRSLVNAGNEVYVVCGSYGSGGTGSNGGTTYTINNGKVTVPSNTWKVIVVLSNGNNDLSRISSTTRVIAVNMPNTQGLNTNWRNHRTTVDAIEAATGYNLLSNVPVSIQNTIEATTDNL